MSSEAAMVQHEAVSAASDETLENRDIVSDNRSVVFPMHTIFRNSQADTVRQLMAWRFVHHEGVVFAVVVDDGRVPYAGAVWRCVDDGEVLLMQARCYQDDRERDRKDELEKRHGCAPVTAEIMASRFSGGTSA